MNTCPYCATELDVLKGEYKGNAVCSFCGNIMFGSTPWGNYSQDGHRINQRKMKEAIFIKDAEKPLYELVTYHTYDLLVCLRLVRLERSETYDALKTFNKASDQLSSEEMLQFKEVTAETGEQYEYWTRKAWQLENILMDRMGYFPERIDDQMLARVKESSLKAQKKIMKISRERRKKG